uniref:Anaphase-promoting complex subunit 4 WD40 domain-containing protein n=1 Tax=Chlamydomonas euryale TaxID=1486919 RepID=A0A7R9VRB2_9CHLO
MALQLRRVIGFNGGLRGACVAHPAAPDCMVTVAGGAVVVSPEDPWALDAQRVLRGHEDRITAFAMSHSGTAMASGSCGRKADVVLWDFASGAVRSCFQEHDMEVVVLAFSPDDRLLLTVGHEKDQKLFVLDAATGKIVTKQPLPYVPGKRVTCAAWGVTQGVAYSFAVGTSDGDVLLYSLQPVQGMAGCVKVTSGSLRRSFTCLTYSADGQWLYAGTSTGDVVTINVLRRSMQMSHPACSEWGACGGCYRLA